MTGYTKIITPGCSYKITIKQCSNSPGPTEKSKPEFKTHAETEFRTSVALRQTALQGWPENQVLSLQKSRGVKC
jgi:hypothetical protein